MQHAELSEGMWDQIAYIQNKTSLKNIFNVIVSVQQLDVIPAFRWGQREKGKTFTDNMIPLRRCQQFIMRV